MIIRTGFQTFEFLQGMETRETPPTEKPKTEGAKTEEADQTLTFASQEFALSWLKRLSLDSNLMARLRQYVMRNHDDPETFRLTDHQALDRLAHLLYIRRVIVTVQVQRSASGKPTAPATSAAPAFPLAERVASAPTSAPPPPVADPPTFPPNIAPSVQAAALIAAAASGAPFCEQCAKAAAAAGSSH